MLTILGRAAKAFRHRGARWVWCKSVGSPEALQEAGRCGDVAMPWLEPGWEAVRQPRVVMHSDGCAKVLCKCGSGHGA